MDNIIITICIQVFISVLDSSGGYNKQNNVVATSLYLFILSVCKYIHHICHRTDCVVNQYDLKIQLLIQVLFHQYKNIMLSLIPHVYIATFL